jgi:UDP-N-acetylmuramate: L-alanyl-gamma-D-glutamyl-meso-diaminopimelate ligase
MDLTNQLKFDQLRSNKGQIKKIFFYRVCGTGMGAAACLLKEKGFHIEGGDSVFAPPMSDYLKSTGIPLHKLSDITPEILKEYDLIVVGNVIPGSSDEARMIEGLGVPFCSFPSALGALILDEVNVVGIAGTHGKTTTTYFMTQLFENLEQKPGYFIGGVIEGRNSSRLGDGRYFFIESDEYDSAYFEKISKFRLYALDSMILTSLEFDHADIFSDVESIKEQFRPTLSKLGGRVIANKQYSAINDLFLEQTEEQKKKWEYYGDGSVIGPKLIKALPDSTKFSLKLGGVDEPFETNIVGWHNILNISSCVLFAHGEGFSLSQIRGAIKNLSMVKRRQEIRGEYRNALILDDFAHHPRAVELTVDAVRTRFPDRELVVVMEPNSATARSAIFQNEFEVSLLGADHVYFTKPARSTSVKGAKDLDCQMIVDHLQAKGKRAGVLSDLKRLLEVIEIESSAKSVILILSNGTCLGLWESEFAKNLHAH